jgi:hypothetical protein
MATVANQVHSTTQQIGARIGWNPIDAETQPPTSTRERVLNLFDPRTDLRVGHAMKAVLLHEYGGPERLKFEDNVPNRRLAEVQY